ncbi:ATP-dependent Clp protease proteolytic subunit, partial [Dissostichus eleginoides]
MFIGFAGRLKPQPANLIKALNYMLRHIYTTMKITLRDSSPVVLTHNQCSCVAGTVLCNHTVALLFQTAHYTQLNMPVVPPVHSCTESEQQWHKPRTMGVKPGPINSMVFTKPVPNRMGQTGVRSGFYRGMVGPLPDPCLFRVTEAYSAFSIEDRPLVTTMNMRPDKPLVESAFGMVQEGSVLSYQMPALTSRYTKLHTDTPPTPHLPIEGYVILPCDLPLKLERFCSLLVEIGLVDDKLSLVTEQRNTILAAWNAVEDHDKQQQKCNQLYRTHWGNTLYCCTKRDNLVDAAVIQRVKMAIRYAPAQQDISAQNNRLMYTLGKLLCM